MFLFSWVARHWRGELRLGVSWWLNCVVLTLLLYWLIPWIAHTSGLAGGQSASSHAAILGLVILQTGIIPLWQMVGLWQATDRSLHTTDRIFTARLGQVAAVLFTLFIATRGLVAGAEQVIAARVAWALGPYQYQVTLLPGAREIELSGGLGFGASAAVEALLASNPGVRRIRLNSGGGALSEGVRLREIIIAHGLDTYSSRECSSACVSAFVGGRLRILQRGARMGFHLPRNWEPLSTGPVSSFYADELRYFQQRGVPEWFLGNWIRSGQKFWYPTEFQLQRAGLVSFLRGVPPHQT
ncbi:MAG: hypothetical protein KJ049_03515 [Gammaproteobacteria bacterium]|jgi:hypothetical protein|nr:hypothetical protein [Gammaproteobacteria bacterium]